jgi:hypothetical protein
VLGYPSAPLQNVVIELPETMVEVGVYPTRTDAELAQTRLEAAGIPSVIAADDAGGAYPFDLTGAGARLLVDESDAEEANRVLTAS